MSEPRPCSFCKRVRDLPTFVGEEAIICWECFEAARRSLRGVQEWMNLLLLQALLPAIGLAWWCFWELDTTRRVVARPSSFLLMSYGAFALLWALMERVPNRIARATTVAALWGIGTAALVHRLDSAVVVALAIGGAILGAATELLRRHQLFDWKRPDEGRAP